VIITVQERTFISIPSGRINLKFIHFQRSCGFAQSLSKEGLLQPLKPPQKPSKIPKSDLKSLRELLKGNLQ
jgi:hypothetical protein